MFVNKALFTYSEAAQQVERSAVLSCEAGCLLCRLCKTANQREISLH